MRPKNLRKGKERTPPLFLFKYFLLQKWLQIKSDPKLESQINDRISFKSFLKLPMVYPSPDHSTFSRFRKRLCREAMMEINDELLYQFHQLGLSINEGIAVDARLVKSTSRPVSINNLMNSKRRLRLLRANWIKMACLKNSPEILILIGLLKMTSLIMVSKYILLLTLIANYSLD